MRRPAPLIALVVAPLLLLACTGADQDVGVVAYDPGTGEADPDPGADAGAGADPDTETGEGTDTDAGGEADPDPGADTGADRGTDGEAIELDGPTEPSTNSTLGHGAVAPAPTDQRLDFDRFRYSLDVPPGFRVTYASGRAGYLVWEEGDADGGFPAYLDTVNYLPADAPDEIGPSSDGAVLRSEETVTVPVHRVGDLAQTVPGVTVEVRQLHYTGGYFGDEWIRIYELDGRTVVANVTVSDGFAGVPDPIALLDAVRIWDGPFEPADLSRCSSFGLPAPAPDPGLTEAQQATVEQLTAALSACDWEALTATVDDRFTASFGGDDALTLWEDGERYDEAPLRTLHTLLTLSPALVEDGLAIWPRAATEEWAALDGTARGELRSLGLGEDDFALYAEFGSYFGYRTGVGADGTWQFYLAGD